MNPRSCNTSPAITASPASAKPTARRPSRGPLSRSGGASPRSASAKKNPPIPSTRHVNTASSASDRPSDPTHAGTRSRADAIRRAAPITPEASPIGTSTNDAGGLRPPAATNRRTANCTSVTIAAA